MNRDTLRQVILDQKKRYQEAPDVCREGIIEEDGNCCLVGLRGAGKSSLLYQRIRELVERGVPENRILYLDLEDERLVEMTEEDLKKLPEIGEEIQYAFLDEPQEIGGWEKAVCHLADQGYTVWIAVSGGKMEPLGGYRMVPVYPPSFREVLISQGMEVRNPSLLGTKQRAKIQRLYRQYLHYGCSPDYPKDASCLLYKRICIDILTEHHLSNSYALRLLLKKTAEHLGEPLSFTRLHGLLTGAGFSISKQTVITYMAAALDAGLLFPVQNYAAKLQGKESVPKYYFADHRFLRLLLVDGDAAQLGNLVAVELARRYGQEQVYYFHGGIDVDFYLPEEKLAIGVGGSSSEKERKKRHRSLPDAEWLEITDSDAFAWLIGEETEYCNL